MNGQVLLVIQQLRAMADEIEKSGGVDIGDFDVSRRIGGGIITKELRLTVYHPNTASNIATVFGVEMPSTLEEEVV